MLLFPGRGTIGSGIGLGTVLPAGLEAKKSVEFIVGVVGGTFAGIEEEELAATLLLLAGLAMTV